MTFPLKFRLRHDGDDVEIEQFMQGVTKYRAHLESIASADQVDPTLFGFFGLDYLFHDRHIRSVEFAPNGQRVTIRMEGCLVVTADDEESHLGDGIALQFHFYGVQWFHNDQFARHSWGFLLRDVEDGPPRIFLSSEVNTLSELIEAAEARARAEVAGAGDPDSSPESVRYHSLLIQTADPRGMIGIVFEYLELEPDEPLAWAMLQENQKYRVPLVTLDEMRRKN